MNSSISRTNQKLYFAKLTLKQITSDQPKIANALREAQHEAYLFHLYGTYLAFLQEIADQYQISTQPQSLMELILEFKQQKNANFIPAEIVEIEYLVQTKTSWLALMLQDYQQVLTPAHSKRASQQAALGSIAIKMETSQTPRLTPEKAANHLKNMEELVSRLRQSMEEW